MTTEQIVNNVVYDYKSGKPIKVPKNQILWESTRDKNGNLKSFVTSDEGRTKYYLYVIDANGKAIKTETARSPKEL